MSHRAHHFHVALLALLTPLLLPTAVLLQLKQAMEVLGCQAWDVGAVLTTDEEVARLNRQVNKERDKLVPETARRSLYQRRHVHHRKEHGCEQTRVYARTRLGVRNHGEE